MSRPAHACLHRGAAIACLLLAGSAWAQTTDELLTHGTDLYRQARYREALAVFEQVLAYPDLSDESTVLTRKYQAFSLFLLHRFDEAAGAYEALLAIDPEYQLDPDLVSPDMIAFFGHIQPPAPPELPSVVQGSALPEARSEEPTPEPAPQPTPKPEPAAAEPPAAEVDLEMPPARGCGVALCLVPLGVGQFANGHPIKGSVLAFLQAASLGTNLYLYWSRVASYRRLRYVEDEKQELRRLPFQRAALILFAAAAVAGIFDAFLFP